MFGLNEYNFIFFPEMTNVVISCLQVRRAEQLGERNITHFLCPSVTDLRWQTPGIPCPTSISLSWARWSPSCLACWWALLPVSHCNFRIQELFFHSQCFTLPDVCAIIVPLIPILPPPSIQVDANRRNSAPTCSWGRATWSASAGVGNQR